MDISVQTLAVPQQPLQAPQGLLPLASIPQINSGVAAYSEGLNQGNTIAAPLDRGISQIGETFSPQGQADIAGARLAKTSFDQENSAAQQTPDLPLGQRRLAGAQINSAMSIIPGETDLQKAQNAENLKNVPFVGAATGANAQLATKGATNQLKSTPDVGLYQSVNNPNPPDDSDIDIYNRNHPDTPLGGDLQGKTPELAAYARQQNAQDLEPYKAGQIGEAKQGAATAIASNPMYALMANGSRKNFHIDPSGKGMTPDETTQQQIVTPDNRIILQDYNKTTHQWLLPNGDVDPDQSPRTPAAQMRMDNMNNRMLINSGVAPENATDQQTQAAHNKSLQVFQDENLGKGEQQKANQVGAQFISNYEKNYAPKLQLFNSADNAIQMALDPNRTGVPDVSLIDLDTRLNTGGRVTHSQTSLIQSAQGILDRIANAPNVIEKGKLLTPEARKDLTDSINGLKNELSAQYSRDRGNFAKLLPKGANPDNYLYSEDAFDRNGQQTDLGSSQSANPSNHSNSIPTVKNADDFHALPSGTGFYTPDGRYKIKP